MFAEVCVFFVWVVVVVDHFQILLTMFTVVFEFTELVWSIIVTNIYRIYHIYDNIYILG